MGYGIEPNRGGIRSVTGTPDQQLGGGGRNTMTKREKKHLDLDGSDQVPDGS